MKCAWPVSLFLMDSEVVQHNDFRSLMIIVVIAIIIIKIAGSFISTILSTKIINPFVCSYDVRLPDFQQTKKASWKILEAKRRQTV